MAFITCETLISAFPEFPFQVDVPVCMPSSDDEGVAAFFQGKAWTELSEADLRYYDLAPTIFSSQGFHRFLPAYIRWFYSSEDHLDSLGEAIIYNLGAQVECAGVLMDRAQTIRSLFTDLQKNLVRQFIADFVAVSGPCGKVIYSNAVALYLDNA